MGQFKFLYMAIISVWLGATTLTFAQQEHVAHYAAYNTALTSGDMIAAADHAQAAWRAAETELGDNKTTAVLAYNYASMVYYAQPENAIEPLKRVIAITGPSDPQFGAKEPGIMLLYVEAETNKSSRKQKDALRQTLKEREAENISPNLLAGRAWTYLARIDLQGKRYKRADRSAENAIRHYTDYHSLAPREAAVPYIQAGIAKLAGSIRSKNDPRDAMHLLDQAIKLFPPQKNIDSFDPLLAIAISWQYIANTANKFELVEYDDPRYRKSTAFKQLPNISGEAGVKWESPRPTSSECNLEWERHDAPDFPFSENRKHYLGAVLIGYHFDGLHTSDVRVLAEVPQKSQFGELSVKTIEKWELEKQPTEACRTNRWAIVSFIPG